MNFPSVNISITVWSVGIPFQVGKGGRFFVTSFTPAVRLILPPAQWLLCRPLSRNEATGA
jgi:hypothetical protein